MSDQPAQKKIHYFRKLVQKIKGYGTKEAISSSTLIKKGPREVKQALKRNESRLILVSGNLRPAELLNPVLKLAESNGVTIVKFANSSDIQGILAVDFPVNIASFSYIPESDVVNVEFFDYCKKEIQ